MRHCRVGGPRRDPTANVSTETNWDRWLGFYATGIADAALSTRQQMLDLVAVRRAVVDRVKESALRAGTAFSLVD
jgi:hypothetical protein